MKRLQRVKHPLSYSFQPGSVCKALFDVFALFRAMLDNAVNTFRLLPPKPGMLAEFDNVMKSEMGSNI